MEQPIKTLSPVKRMPFTLVIAMRLLVLIPIFGVSVLMIITGIPGLFEGDIIELPTLLLGIVFFVFTSSFLLKIFVLEKIRLSQLQYLFYPDRLVIYNQVTNQIIHDLSFEDFPSFTFRENLNNFGYIIIGKEEPVMARGGIFGQNYGINMKDPDIMLENLPEVKKEYLFLKELIAKYQEEHHTFSWEFDK